MTGPKVRGKNFLYLLDFINLSFLTEGYVCQFIFIISTSFIMLYILHRHKNVAQRGLGTPPKLQQQTSVRAKTRTQ